MNGFDFSTIQNVFIGGAQASSVYLGTTKIWPISQHDYSQDYLTFEALEPGTFTWYNNNETHNVFYSTDNGTTWTEIAAGVPTETINTDQKIILKANWQYHYPGYFIATGRFNVMGNIMSLVYGDLFINNNTLATIECFFRLFYNCSTLVDASNLILPATTLTRNCYAYMFEGCSSLTTAPELPATTLAYQCYVFMFAQCSSLNYIKCLATDISATECTNYWLYNVASSGTFVKDASMTSWSSGDSGIPSGWTIQDAS